MIFKKIVVQVSLLVCFIFGTTPLFAQFTIPKKPAVATSVYDYAKLLNQQEKAALENKLIQYFDSTSTQIVVAIVPTINGESIGILAPKWGHEWGVGQAKEDNGVFILLAVKEREIWLAPGYGLEPILTAGMGGEITRNEIIPYFKKGQYYEGLQSGTDALILLFKGAYKKSAAKNDNSEIGVIGSLLFIGGIIFLVFIFSKSNNGGRGGKGGGRGFLQDVAAASILSSILSGSNTRGGFGGGGFGGGGGGGFGGGFGGGGFSGGGSGGSW